MVFFLKGNAWFFLRMLSYFYEQCYMSRLTT